MNFLPLVDFFVPFGGGDVLLEIHGGGGGDPAQC